MRELAGTEFAAGLYEADGLDGDSQGDTRRNEPARAFIEGTENLSRVVAVANDDDMGRTSHL